jgi:hypothetical protein
MTNVVLDRANKAIIQSGSGVPDSNTRGNVYLDTATGTLYVRTAPAEAWTEITGGGGDSFWLRDETEEAVYPATITDKLIIGTNSESSASAIVDIVSTDRGFLGPKMTTAQRDLIASPATGLKIFNTTTGKENFYNGASWEELISGDISSWSGITTDDSVTEIYLGGITNNYYVLQENSTTVFQLTCIARDGVSNKSKVWKIEAVAQRDSSDNSSLVGTPTFTVIAQSDLSGGTDDWDIDLDIYDASETVKLWALGAAATTISWTIRG